MNTTPLHIRKLANLKGHAGAIINLSNSWENNIILSASVDHFSAAWNLKSFQSEKFSIKVDYPVYAVLYIEKLEILLLGNGNGGLHVIDMKEKREIKCLQNHQFNIFEIYYAENLATIITTSSDGSIAFINSSNFTTEKILKLSFQKVRKGCLSHSDQYFWVACGDCSIRKIDVKEQKEIIQFGSHSLSANVVKVLENKNLIITGGRDAHLNFFDLEGKIIQSIPAHNFAVYDIQFIHNQQYFATASRDKTIKIWTLEGEIVCRIDRLKNQGHQNSVNCLLWKEENQLLISGSDDKTMMVWEIKQS